MLPLLTHFSQDGSPGKAQPNILPVKLPGLVSLLGNTRPVHRVCLCVYTNIWISFLNKTLSKSQSTVP